MDIGFVYPDSDQRHPHAFASYCGNAVLQTRHPHSFDDPPNSDVAMHYIMLSVPPSMQRMVLDYGTPVRASCSLVPWAAGGGLGILVVNAGANSVVAVADIAGRLDLMELQVAARLGMLSAGLNSEAFPSETLLVPVDGFADALSEARTLRRLSARELAEAVADVRTLLRGQGALGLLGRRPVKDKLDTLTINCCPL